MGHRRRGDRGGDEVLTKSRAESSSVEIRQQPPRKMGAVKTVDAMLASARRAAPASAGRLGRLIDEIGDLPVGIDRHHARKPVRGLSGASLQATVPRSRCRMGADEAA